MTQGRMGLITYLRFRKAKKKFNETCTAFEKYCSKHEGCHVCDKLAGDGVCDLVREIRQQAMAIETEFIFPDTQ